MLAVAAGGTGPIGLLVALPPPRVAVTLIWKPTSICLTMNVLPVVMLAQPPVVPCLRCHWKLTVPLPGRLAEPAVSVYPTCGVPVMVAVATGVGTGPTHWHHLGSLLP